MNLFQVDWGLNIRINKSKVNGPSVKDKTLYQINKAIAVNPKEIIKKVIKIKHSVTVHMLCCIVSMICVYVFFMQGQVKKWRQMSTGQA
jgi:hypothetical protein